MPRNKDLKRLVRARMSKTGESYTASRAQILAKTTARSQASTAVLEPPAAAQAPAATPDYATLAGTADATIKARTGCTWQRWVAALDYHGAERMSHRDIAALISAKYKIDGWWAQAVTVGYERIKGLRERGQRRNGTYEASKSRTYNVPVETLFNAWVNARRRNRWLEGRIGKVRTHTKNRSMRLDGKDSTIVAVGFWSKGPTKSAVSVQHTKVRDRETANHLKQYWSERLDALEDLLASA
jgi:hypothetical protein